MHDIVIAQLTDFHIGPESDPICSGNMDRLQACIDRIKEMRRVPDLLLLTGDLTEYGDDESLERALDCVSQLNIPSRIAFGNHDVMKRTALSLRRELQLSDAWAGSSGKVSLRVVTADTGKTGHHGGVFDEADVAKLSEALCEHPNDMTLLAIHHPPCPIGIDWMDPRRGELWVERIEQLIKSSPQIAGVVCGHVHVSAHTMISGARVSVCPAVAPQSRVELAQVDENRPDGRTLIERSPPGFALHQFLEDKWTTLPIYVGEAASLVRFDPKNTGIVEIIRERR